MAWTVCLALICVYIQTTIGEEASGGPVVDTKYGKLQGTTLHIPDNDKPSFAFLNVPYAAPPVGELRFEPPQPLESWSGLRDATKFGLPCIHDVKAFFNEELLDMPIKHPEGTSEDCLHLNIYTPSVSGSKAVMFWIHGGGWTNGWASHYDGRVYAILEDVVVVIIQYRLNHFGFATTGDDVMPGNMLLKDQIAALKWVNENIANFGGDPQKITIFGESAGSMSVSAMLMIPEAKGLFQRGIMQSGSIYDGLFIHPSLPMAARSTLQLAKSLNCNTDNMQDVKSCLQKQPLDRLTLPPVLLALPEQSFWAVVDGKFLPDLPHILMSEGRFQKDIDLIMGLCQTEGYLGGRMLIPNFLQDDLTLDVLQQLAVGYVSTTYPSQPDLIEPLTKAIVNEYQEGTSADQIRKAFTEFFGETLLKNPTYKTALEVKDKGKGNIFVYEMSFRPPTSTKPSWITTDHFEDIFYTFGVPLLDYDERYHFREEDKEMAKMTLKYWANFAKTGDPNGDGLARWPSFREDKASIRLKPQPEMFKNFGPERLKFWLETVPGIVDKFSHSKDQTKRTEL